MSQPTLTSKHLKRPLVTVIASIILAMVLFLYILETSFRDDGRITAPDAAFYVPVFWIIAGLLVFKLPKLSIAIYAIAAILLFFERGNYEGFVVWGFVSLVLAAMASWSSMPTNPRASLPKGQGTGK